MSQKKLSSQIREIQSKLETAEKLAYEDPNAGSVRPTISQARVALSALPFREQVERLDD